MYRVCAAQFRAVRRRGAGKRRGKVLTKYNQRLGTKGETGVLANHQRGVAREINLSIAGDVRGGGVHEGVARATGGRYRCWVVGHYL